MYYLYIKMVEPLAIVMIILLTCASAIIVNRVLNYMKNNHWCDKVYAEG